MRHSKILVTGGQGYVGSVLAPALLRTGAEVVVLDNGSFSSVRSPAPNLTYVQGDIRHPLDWESALEGVSAVVHLAAVVGDPACDVDQDAAWETNYLGTVRVAEASRRHGVRRLVFASTCSTYGVSGGESVDIWSPLNPQSLYARTKVLAEHYLLSPHASGPDVHILRFATVHGLSPRMRFDLAVNVMTAHAVRRGAVTVHGGQQWRPFLHVKDAASAVLCSLAAPASREVGMYNCGSDDENYTIAALADLIAREVPGTAVEVLPGATDPRDYRVNFERIGHHLSFARRYGVTDSVREIRDAVRGGAFHDYDQPVYSNHLTAVETGAKSLV